MYLFYINCRINHTVILDDPFDDPKGLEIPDRSPEPTKEQLEVRLGYNHYLLEKSVNMDFKN